MKTQIKIKHPNVLLLDIETSPILGWAWQTYDTSILKIFEPSKIISVAWKELGASSVHVKSIADYKGYKAGTISDEKLVREVWEVLDKADVVIAHYGNSFDFKKLNARFVWYGLPAPSAYKTIDTKTAAKKYFKFDSNSLNNLGEYLGVGKKLENGGFDLWVRCIENGEKLAWELMKKYNAQDVNLLEQVYLKLRPYMDNHPSLSIFNGDNKPGICPTCLSGNVQKRGFAITRTGRKQRYQCSDCGSWSSGPYEKAKNTLVHDDD